MGDCSPKNCNATDDVSKQELYVRQRSEILLQERYKALGGNVKLNSQEELVDEALQILKNYEFQLAKEDLSQYAPSKNYLHSKPLVEKSKVYQILKKLPKGGSLHTHFLAASSAEFLFNLTFNDDIYLGEINGVKKLKLFSSHSLPKQTTWRLLKDIRKNDFTFDNDLKRMLSLQPDMNYEDQEMVWRDFRKIFSLTFDLLACRPIFKKYVTGLLAELLEDCVYYVELRTTFMELYEVDGRKYSELDFVRIFQETVTEFCKTNTEFIGAKLILAPFRQVDNKELVRLMKVYKEVNEKYPGVMVGVDLVGFEDEGRPLKDYVDEFLVQDDDLNFFFHAGETHWTGTVTDDNLLDAILLNTRRIGHGLALARRPVLLDLARKKNITVEVCPISNQVLRQVGEDLREHPAVGLIASGHPIVVCNDDPSYWSSGSPLSADWYMVLMAMAGERAGLPFLKELAFNSLRASGMKDEEKIQALQRFENLWNSSMTTIRSFILLELETLSDSVPSF